MVILMALFLKAGVHCCQDTGREGISLPYHVFKFYLEDHSDREDVSTLSLGQLL